MSEMDHIWFTSDTHFNHRLAFEMRPWASSVSEMNEMLISDWNDRVGKHDRVYHLGDVSLRNPSATRELLDRLNGKIYLVRGNHESVAESTFCRDRFEWIRDVHMLKVKCESPYSHGGKTRVWLSHYAHRTWPGSHHGVLHLYGHSHGMLPDDSRLLSLDIGIDAVVFHAPVNLSWVVRRMSLSKHWKRPASRRDEAPPLE
jgi:calcineurin-like phosphoesterase family protein